jgi:hypothetical protein
LSAIFLVTLLTPEKHVWTEVDKINPITPQIQKLGAQKVYHLEQRRKAWRT